LTIGNRQKPALDLFFVNCVLPFSQKRAIGKSKGNCVGFPYKTEEIINNFQTAFELKKWIIFGDFLASSRPSPKEKASNAQPSLLGEVDNNQNFRKC